MSASPAPKHGIGDADLIANAEWMGGAALIETAGQRSTMEF